MQPPIIEEEVYENVEYLQEVEESLNDWKVGDIEDVQVLDQVEESIVTTEENDKENEIVVWLDDQHSMIESFELMDVDDESIPFLTPEKYDKIIIF